jgi:phospholipase C
MIVVSPWTRGGFVSSQVFDHTSVLRFLEARFGVEEPNISDWRRRTCGDLTSVFDFKRPNFNWPLLPSTDAEAARDAACRTRLPALPLLGFQDAPHQEKGKRRQRPF